MINIPVDKEMVLDIKSMLNLSGADSLNISVDRGEFTLLHYSHASFKHYSKRIDNLQSIEFRADKFKIGAVFSKPGIVSIEKRDHTIILTRYNNEKAFNSSNFNFLAKGVEQLDVFPMSREIKDKVSRFNKGIDYPLKGFNALQKASKLARDLEGVSLTRGYVVLEGNQYKCFVVSPDYLADTYLTTSTVSELLNIAKDGKELVIKELDNYILTKKGNILYGFRQAFPQEEGSLSSYKRLKNSETPEMIRLEIRDLFDLLTSLNISALVDVSAKFDLKNEVFSLKDNKGDEYYITFSSSKSATEDVEVDAKVLKNCLAKLLSPSYSGFDSFNSAYEIYKDELSERVEDDGDAEDEEHLDFYSIEEEIITHILEDEEDIETGKGCWVDLIIYSSLVEFRMGEIILLMVRA